MATPALEERGAFAVAADLLESAHRVVLEPHQRMPESDWTYWLLVAGRGTGKTQAGAYWLDDHVQGPPCIPNIPGGHRPVIVAPTLGDCVESVEHAPSSLKAQNPGIRVVTVAGGTEVRWPNGARGRMLGAYTPEDVERLRAAGNSCICWAEEFAAWRKLEQAWHHIQLGLRVGPKPRAIITTTPKPREVLKNLMANTRSVVTTARTQDAVHLSPDRKAELIELYGDTRLGRQELDAEILEDVEGALWRREHIVQGPAPPQLDAVVVAVDPAMTSSGDSAETGIVVVGRASERGYVLDDRSGRFSPAAVAETVASAYDDWEADAVVVEVNAGGDWVRDTIQGHRSALPVRTVHASRGKRTRAEPVAALYERGLVTHVGAFTELEDQLVMWEPDAGEPSPDRLDALVWGMHALFVGGKRTVRAVYEGPRKRISPY